MATPLFDPKTFTSEQLASLVNKEGVSLADSNSASQIQTVQQNPGVITPQTLTKADPLKLNNPDIPPVTSPITLTPQEQIQSDTTQRVEQRNIELAGKPAYQTEQNTIAGVDTAQNNIRDLTAQLQGLKNEAAAIPLQLQQQAQGKAIISSVLGAQENSRLRTNAIASLGVSTLLAASQGQLANAQALADKAVEAKFGPLEAQNKADIANLKLIADDPATSLADKNRADKQLAIKTANDAKIAQDKADFASVQKIAVDAASNMKNFIPTPEYKTYPQAVTAIQNEKDPVKATLIAQQTGLLKSAVSAASGTSIVNVNGHTKLINDLTGETIKDLGVANSEISSGGGGGTVAERLQSSIASMATQLNSVVGTDGYIDPQDYRKAKKAWVNAGHASAEFDKSFSIYRNPTDSGYNID